MLFNKSLHLLLCHGPVNCFGDALDQVRWGKATAAAVTYCKLTFLNTCSGLHAINTYSRFLPFLSLRHGVDKLSCNSVLYCIIINQDN
jgi:hypothetical protein